MTPAVPAFGTAGRSRLYFRAECPLGACPGYFRQFPCLDLHTPGNPELSLEGQVGLNDPCLDHHLRGFSIQLFQYF